VAVTDKWIAYPASSTQIKGGFEAMGQINFNMGYHFIALENSKGRRTELASSSENVASSRSAILTLHINKANTKLTAIKENGNIELWDIEKKKLMYNAQTIEKVGYGGGIYSCYSNADDLLYFIVDGKNHLYTFSCTDFKLDSIELASKNYSAIAINEDTRTIVLGNTEGNVSFYSLTSNTLSESIAISKWKISDISSYGKAKNEYIITSGTQIVLLNSDYKKFIPYQNLPALVSPFDISISKENILVAAQQNSAYLIDLAVATTIKSIHLNSFIYFSKLSPDDSTLILVTEDSVFAFQFPEMKMIYAFKNDGKRPREVNFSPIATCFV
jgi:WD40 repeat protein